MKIPMKDSFRRLKKDVLNDLPVKRREVVNLTDDSIYTNISKLREAKNAYSGAKVSHMIIVID